MLDCEEFECSLQRLLIESNEDVSNKEVNKDGSMEGLLRPRDRRQEWEGDRDVRVEAAIK